MIRIKFLTRMTDLHSESRNQFRLSSGPHIQRLTVFTGRQRRRESRPEEAAPETASSRGLNGRRRVPDSRPLPNTRVSGGRRVSLEAIYLSSRLKLYVPFHW